MFRYRAQNVNGWGQYSSVTTIQAARVPDSPSSITVVNSYSTSITIQMGECLENGGSLLTQYTLYRDDGTHSSNFIQIYSGVYVQNFIVTGLTAGLEYRFKSSVSNAIGSSQNSTEVRWFAACLPDQPAQLSSGPLTTRTTIQLIWPV